MTLGFSLKQDKFWDCCSHLNWADSRVDLCSDTFSYEVHIKFICSLCSQFFSHMFSRIWFTCSTPSFQSTADEKFRLFVIIDCRSGSGKIWEDLDNSDIACDSCFHMSLPNLLHILECFPLEILEHPSDADVHSHSNH